MPTEHHHRRNGGNMIHIVAADSEITWQYSVPRPQDVWQLPNGNTVVCNWGGHGHVGQQPQIFEVTPDKKVVWQIYDYKKFNTISNIQLLDIKADPTKNQILR